MTVTLSPGLVRLQTNCMWAFPGNYTWRLSLFFSTYAGESFRPASFLFRTTCANPPVLASPAPYIALSVVSLLLSTVSLYVFNRAESPEDRERPRMWVQLSLACCVSLGWMAAQCALSVAPFPESDDSGHWGVGLPIIAYSQFALVSYCLSDTSQSLSNSHRPPEPRQRTSAWKLPVFARLLDHADGLDAVFTLVVGLPNLYHLVNDQLYGHELFHTLVAVMICQIGFWLAAMQLGPLPQTVGLSPFAVLVLNGLLFYGHPQHSQLSLEMHSIGALLSICWSSIT